MDLEGPAMVPPDGVEPNFENPENQNALAWGVLTTCVVVATVSLLLRAYGRVYLMRKVQAEEIMAFLAYGCFWGSIWPTFAMIDRPGYFVHTWDVQLKEMIPITRWILIFGVCYSFVLPLLKIAIMIEWIRLFIPQGTRTSSPIFWGCIFVSFVQVGAGIATIVALNLQCIPHQRIWDFTIEGECFDLHKLQVASATIHLVCDIIMILLPQHIIWTLRMSWQKRMGVSFVFGLGLLACVSAAFRLATTLAYGKSADALFSLGPLVFWATAEMTCGFFIVCVPCLPKILKDSGVIRKLKSTFGMKNTTINPSNKNTNGYGSGGNTLNSKLATTSSNAYYKLDEQSHQMKDLRGSDSTENLREGNPHNGITKITRITVSEQPRSVSDNEDVDHRGNWR